VEEKPDRRSDVRRAFDEAVAAQEQAERDLRIKSIIQIVAGLATGISALIALTVFANSTFSLFDRNQSASASQVSKIEKRLALLERRVDSLYARNNVSPSGTSVTSDQAAAINRRIEAGLEAPPGE